MNDAVVIRRMHQNVLLKQVKDVVIMGDFVIFLQADNKQTGYHKNSIDSWSVRAPETP